MATPVASETAVVVLEHGFQPPEGSRPRWSTQPRYAARPTSHPCRAGGNGQTGDDRLRNQNNKKTNRGNKNQQNGSSGSREINGRNRTMINNSPLGDGQRRTSIRNGNETGDAPSAAALLRTRATKDVSGPAHKSRESRGRQPSDGWWNRQANARCPATGVNATTLGPRNLTSPRKPGTRTAQPSPVTRNGGPASHTGSRTPTTTAPAPVLNLPAKPNYAHFTDNEVARLPPHQKVIALAMKKAQTDNVPSATECSPLPVIPMAALSVRRTKHQETLKVYGNTTVNISLRDGESLPVGVVPGRSQSDTASLRNAGNIFVCPADSLSSKGSVVHIAGPSFPSEKGLGAWPVLKPTGLVETKEALPAAFSASKRTTEMCTDPSASEKYVASDISASRLQASSILDSARKQPSPRHGEMLGAAFVTPTLQSINGHLVVPSEVEPLNTGQPTENFTGANRAQSHRHNARVGDDAGARARQHDEFDVGRQQTTDGAFPEMDYASFNEAPAALDTKGCGNPASSTESSDFAGSTPNGAPSPGGESAPALTSTKVTASLRVPECYIVTKYTHNAVPVVKSGGEPISGEDSTGSVKVRVHDERAGHRPLTNFRNGARDVVNPAADITQDYITNVHTSNLADGSSHEYRGFAGVDTDEGGLHTSGEEAPKASANFNVLVQAKSDADGVCASASTSGLTVAVPQPPEEPLIDVESETTETNQGSASTTQHDSEAAGEILYIGQNTGGQGHSLAERSVADIITEIDPDEAVPQESASGCEEFGNTEGRKPAKVRTTQRSVLEIGQKEQHRQGNRWPALIRGWFKFASGNFAKLCATEGSNSGDLPGSTLQRAIPVKLPAFYEPFPTRLAPATVDFVVLLSAKTSPLV